MQRAVSHCVSKLPLLSIPDVSCLGLRERPRQRGGENLGRTVGFGEYIGRGCRQQPAQERLTWDSPLDEMLFIEDQPAENVDETLRLAVVGGVRPIIVFARAVSAHKTLEGGLCEDSSVAKRRFCRNRVIGTTSSRHQISPTPSHSLLLLFTQLWSSLEMLKRQRIVVAQSTDQLTPRGFSARKPPANDA